MGETFYLIEKITSPAHYENFASLICSVRRGINAFTRERPKIASHVHPFVNEVDVGRQLHVGGGHRVYGENRHLKKGRVSILTTFYEQLFPTKEFCAALLYLQLGSEFFW